MGAQAFNFIQYGKETTRGTSVAATKRWPGTWNKLPIDTKKAFVPEMLDVRAAERRSRIDEKLFRHNLISPNATFQQLPVLFGAGIKALTAGSETTPAQGDYPWAIAPSMTAANSPDALTLEFGNTEDSICYEAEYAMFDKINISGQVDQDGGESPVSIDAGFFARQLTAVTKTGSIALPSGTFMNSKRARLFIDTSWSGVGGTELSNLLRSFQIEILTGLAPDFTGSAAEYFNAHTESVIGVMGNFTIKGGSSAWSIFAAARAAGLVVCRLQIDGPQIGSGVNHQLRLDFSGDYEDVSPLDTDNHGQNDATFSIHGLYDTTGAKIFQGNIITDSNAY